MDTAREVIDCYRKCHRLKSLPKRDATPRSINAMPTTSAFPQTQGVHQNSIPCSGDQSIPTEKAHTSATDSSHHKDSSVSPYFQKKQVTGTKLQSIQRTIRDFNIISMQFELTRLQKSCFFINTFDGSARDFFCDNCTTDMKFEGSASIMTKEYDSDARQLASHEEHNRVIIDKVMEDEGIIDLDTCLTKLVDKINSLTPQCPGPFRGDLNKRHFLRNAVFKHSWAERAISQMTTAKFTYNGLITVLPEQIQIEEERREILEPSSTLYERYGRPPPKKNFRSTQYKYGGKINLIGRDGKRMLCRLCGSDQHFIIYCPPGTVKAKVRNKLNNRVLAVNVPSQTVCAIELGK